MTHPLNPTRSTPNRLLQIMERCIRPTSAFLSRPNTQSSPQHPAAARVPPIQTVSKPSTNHSHYLLHCVKSTSNNLPLTSITQPPPSINDHDNDSSLLTLLRQRKTEEAWATYATDFSDHLPNSTCLSRLVAQLSYQNTPESLFRAQSIVRRLRDQRQLHRLDANSLGLHAVSAAKAGSISYAASVVKSMLRSGYLPHVKAWSAVVSRLGASGDDGPAEALRLFDAVLRRVRAADAAAAADSRPDTGAFNGALNACANLGDVERFAKLFDEMPEFSVEPDVLTFNVMIKLVARANRKDLLVVVLEQIIELGITPCITTFHSLVAAYVGFGDLETVEKMVQAMREGRDDICRILREANSEEPNLEGDGVLEKLLLKFTPAKDNGSPPLLPKTYLPNSRTYTTLMKGYMNEGRLSDVVRMLEAMRHQSESASHPDHVTYTTVITALVKEGSMDRARYLLAEMARVGVPANRVTYNVLLRGYCQQLRMEKARDLIQEMQDDAGIAPDVVSYNILIDGCILVDDCAGALNFFNEMRSRGIGPSKISYTTLMKAFVASGQTKLAHQVFDGMLKDPRVKPDLVAWNMLIEGYCKLGLVEEAKNLVQRMKESGIYPDVATYGSLANGIALARKPGEALVLWNEIKERCALPPSSLSPTAIKPDEGLLESLADVCVRAAFFKKALEIVACMEEYGISPNKARYKKIYIEMHSNMFTSKHASKARQDRRIERKRAAEAFKFWLGLPNSYYGSEWRLEPAVDEDLI
ncbi:hypothetical protein ACLOJK_032030 [Asimina triloba]